MFFFSARHSKASDRCGEDIGDKPLSLHHGRKGFRHSNERSSLVELFLHARAQGFAQLYGSGAKHWSHGNTSPLLFDPCTYALLMVQVCSLHRYCRHMSCIHYRHGMPESEVSPTDSGHMSTSQVLRIPESYFEEKSLGQHMWNFWNIVKILLGSFWFIQLESRLQVLRYKLGQYYDAHRDYWDPSEFPDKQRFLHPQSRTWNMRHATLLWYLQRPEEGAIRVEGCSSISMSSLLKDVINMLQRTVGVDFRFFGWKLDLIDTFSVRSVAKKVVKLGFHGLMEGLFPGMIGLLAMIVESRWGAAVWQSCSTRFIPVESLCAAKRQSILYFLIFFEKWCFITHTSESNFVAFYPKFTYLYLMVSYCLLSFVGCRLQDIDSFSWHCGCPVRRGTKWAANSWVWNQPQEAPPFAQRRATVGQSELWGDENGTYIRGGMVGGERCFRCEPVLDFNKTKKSHLEDSPAVPFLGQGLGCKGRKSHEQRCACGGKRRHVPDFHRFSRRFYAASVSEASWCLEIGLTLGSIQLTGSCPRSIPADAQLRKELQIIWKRHMATSKAWAASEKNMYSLLPFILVFPCLPFFVFFLKFPIHWQIWVRIRDATLLLRIYFVAHLYPGWTAWADRVAPLPGLGVYTSPCLDTAARYSGPKQQQKNAPIFFRYSNGVLFWRSGIPMDISMGLFVSNFVSPNSERAWKKKTSCFLHYWNPWVPILGFSASRTSRSVGLQWCWCGFGGAGSARSLLVWEKSSIAQRNGRRFPVCCWSHTYITWAV